MKCAHCGSRDTQANVAQYQCFVCGACTWFDGTAVLVDEDRELNQVLYVEP